MLLFSTTFSCCYKDPELEIETIFVWMRGSTVFWAITHIEQLDVRSTCNSIESLEWELLGISGMGMDLSCHCPLAYLSFDVVLLTQVLSPREDLRAWHSASIRFPRT